MFRILIVEDNNHFRLLIKDTLESEFPAIEVHEAADGEEALKKVDALLPDLIFMDIKLPGENGLELTKKIKSKYPEIIIAVLTSYDLPEYREAAYKYKANHFLTKGLASQDYILTLVESVLSDQDNDKGLHG